MFGTMARQGKKIQMSLREFGSSIGAAREGRDKKFGN
jgi:hypothetical protein